jgi:RNA polymerase-binding transcription factor DksA
MISAVSGTDQDFGEAQPDRAEPDGARWRSVLDGLWRRKLDEVIALSAACDGTFAADPDRFADGPASSSLRLRDRANRAFADLAAVEDAIARTDDGSYGLCAACGQPMSEEWLAEEPQIRHCPECALLLVVWRSSRARSGTQPAWARPVGATVPHPAPANRARHQPSASSATVVLPIPA